MSNLNYGAIDETYPIAGQDNNSQGFRSNFSAIKTSLGLAQEAITTLENNRAKLNDTNNFLGNTISNAVINKVYGATYPLNNITSPQFIDLNNGPLQYVTFAGNTTVTFKSWPDTGKYAVVRLHLIGDGNAIRTATLATEQGGTFAPEASITLVNNAPTFSLATTGKHKVVEAWTYNGGAKVFLRYLGEF